MAKFFKDKNDKLTQESFDQLQTELETAQTESAKRATEIETLTAQIETLTAEKATLTESNKTLTEDLTQAKTETKEALDSIEPKANALAIQIASKAGHEEDLDLDDDAESGKSVSREDFAKMSPSEKSEFSKAGGKIK